MHKVSPSQISTFRSCPRKWWLGSVAKIATPDHPSAVLGSAVHATLESRIATGKWSEVSDFEAKVAARAVPIAQVAWDALDAIYPSRIEGALVEQDVTLPDRYALPVRGRVDLVLDGAIVDWKTTSSLRWVKSADERAIDPQVILYAQALAESGLVDVPTRFLHVWVTTRGKPAVQITHTIVPRKIVEGVSSSIRATVDEMSTYLAVPEHEVPQCLASCSAYGGCAYKSRCFESENIETQKEIVMNTADPFLRRRKALDEIVQTPVESSLNTPSFASPAPEAPAPQAPAPAPQAPAPQAPVRAAKSTTSRMLLIGCHPLVGLDGAMLCDEYLVPFREEAASLLGVDYWGMAEYGKGKSMVATLVAKHLREHEPPQILIVDRRSALCDAAVEALLPYYPVVINKLG